MKVVGLTGSIGMGKTATAGLFAEAGVPVWDADAAVRRLYAKGGAAVASVRSLFPDAVIDESVDRETLRARLAADPDGFRRLEAAVHPLVAVDRADFLASVERSGADLAVVDVPLLFETGADALVDAVVVASAPEALQRQRVLSREGMTAERFETLLARQLPDAEKRRRADFVIDTGAGFDVAREQVGKVIAALRSSDFVSRRG
jgi:dephospho-CoA kinase